MLVGKQAATLPFVRIVQCGQHCARALAKSDGEAITRAVAFQGERVAILDEAARFSGVEGERFLPAPAEF